MSEKETKSIEKNIGWFLKIVKSIAIRNLSSDSIDKNKDYKELPSPYFEIFTHRNEIDSAGTSIDFNELICKSECVNECCNASWVIQHNYNVTNQALNNTVFLIKFKDIITNNLIFEQVIYLSKLIFIPSMNLSKISALPLNLILFSNEDGVFMLESLYQNVFAVSAGNVKYQSPDNVNNLELMNQQNQRNDNMKSLEEELIQVNNRIANKRIMATDELYDQQLIIELTKKLEHEESLLQEEKLLEQDELSTLLSISDLSIDLSTCVDLSHEINDLNNLLTNKYEILQKNQFLLEAKQLKLLNELQSIYPITSNITSNGEVYMIRGIELPIDLSNQRDDELLSSGLGYIVHLLLLSSKYLEIPLRYQLFYYASRSMIRDPVSSSGQALPLYRKNNDRERFERAIIWLKKDVEQILASRGLNYDSTRDILYNLNQLFACQLCQGMAF